MKGHCARTPAETCPIGWKNLPKSCMQIFPYALLCSSSGVGGKLSVFCMGWVQIHASYLVRTHVYTSHVYTSHVYTTPSKQNFVKITIVQPIFHEYTVKMHKKEAKSKTHITSTQETETLPPTKAEAPKQRLWKICPTGHKANFPSKRALLHGGSSGGTPLARGGSRGAAAQAAPRAGVWGRRPQGGGTKLSYQHTLRQNPTKVQTHSTQPLRQNHDCSPENTPIFRQNTQGGS
jgi:hypothetical protein